MRVEIMGRLKQAMDQPSSELAPFAPFVWRTLEGYRSGRLMPPPFAARGWRHGTRLSSGVTVWIHLKKINEHIQAANFHIDQKSPHDA